MSRYMKEIQDPKTDKILEVVIGWDHPLLSYFGQVHDRSLPEEEQIIVWVGGSVRELYEIEDLQMAMPTYCRSFIRKNAVALYRDKDDGE